MRTIGFGRMMIAAAVAAIGLVAAGPAAAQFRPFNMAGPAIMPGAPGGAFAYNAIGMPSMAPAAYNSAGMPAPPPSGPFRVQMSGSFPLAQTSEQQVSDTVTRAQYAANGVTLNVYPVGPWGATLNLVGNVTVTTETTMAEDGNGTVTGTLTFTGRLPNGAMAPFIAAPLQGTVQDGSGSLTARGQLRIPGTTAYARPSAGNFTATLSSDGNLATTLDGVASIWDV